MIMLDKEKVIVSKYKEFIYLSDEYIKILEDKDYICIYGKCLSVEYFDCIEIRINGTIRSVVYENRI